MSASCSALDSDSDGEVSDSSSGSEKRLVVETGEQRSTNQGHAWGQMLIEEELTDVMSSNFNVDSNEGRKMVDRNVESYPIWRDGKKQKSKKKKKKNKNKDKSANQLQANPEAKKDSKPTKPFTVRQIKSEAFKIAKKLNEKRFDIIARFVKAVGLDQSNKVLRQVLSIESEGGMKTLKGDRKRTPGGVFFHLIRRNYPSEIVQKVFQENPNDVKVKRRNPRSHHKKGEQEKSDNSIKIDPDPETKNEPMDNSEV